MGKIRKTETRGTEYERFGANLASARIAAGLSQSEMAERMEIPQSTYCGYETGTRKVPLSQIIALAAALNTTPDALIGTKEMGIPVPSKNNMELSAIEMEMVRRFRMLGPGERGMLLRSLGIDETSEKRDATTA